VSQLPSGRPLPTTPLFQTALTHASYAGEHGCVDNERLEHLGDAVLQLYTTTRLYRDHPDLDVKDLTELRKRAVNNGRLAVLARQIGLASELRLGVGEDKSGGRDKGGILADAMEAVIGAVFLEEGAAAAQVEVEAALSLLGPGLTGFRSARTRLQEWWQAQYKQPPPYGDPTSEGPAHELVFEVSLEVSELELAVVGRGRTKTDAHEDAAARALIELERTGRITNGAE
jgi:ribonuclease III